MPDALREQEIEAGDPATILYYSDRDPATVVEVVRFKSGKKKGLIREVVIQEDSYERTDGNGMSDAQEYTYSRNPDGRKYRVRPYQGHWQADGGLVHFGSRRRYYDFTF